MEMKDILNRMLNHEELSREETKNIIVGITKSEFPEEQITALLTGLQMRGVTVDELLGFRDGNGSQHHDKDKGYMCDFHLQIGQNYYD